MYTYTCILERILLRFAHHFEINIQTIQTKKYNIEDTTKTINIHVARLYLYIIYDISTPWYFIKIPPPPSLGKV